MTQWIIDGNKIITSGHGESDTLIRIHNETVPCDILITDCGNPTIQKLVAEYIINILNVSDETYHRAQDGIGE